MNPYPSSVIITVFIMELAPVPKRCCVSFQTQRKVLICPESIQHIHTKTEIGQGDRQHTNKDVGTSIDSWHNSCHFVVKKCKSLVWVSVFYSRSFLPSNSLLSCYGSHTSPHDTQPVIPNTEVTDRIKKGSIRMCALVTYFLGDVPVLLCLYKGLQMPIQQSF